MTDAERSDLGTDESSERGEVAPGNSADQAYELVEAYDRITRECELFDYEAFADSVIEQVGDRARVLELCVGTGSVAEALADRGCTVVGIDLSQEMLDAAAKRLKGKGVDLIHDSASDFNLDGEVFDAVVIHSGHMIASDTEVGLYINTSDLSMIPKTLEAASRHLRTHGRLIMNVEGWSDFRRDLPDGSYYDGRIVEDTDGYGTRFHRFFDAHDETTHRETVVRQPRIPLELFKEIAEAYGATTSSIIGNNLVVAF